MFYGGNLRRLRKYKLLQLGYEKILSNASMLDMEFKLKANSNEFVLGGGRIQNNVRARVEIVRKKNEQRPNVSKDFPTLKMC